MKIIGVCGGTGSGKSFIVDLIKQELGGNEVSTVSMDDYYKEIELQPVDTKGVENFDTLQSIYFERLINDIERLKKGDSVSFMKYTFNNDSSESYEEIVHPNKFLLVEGIFVFSLQELLEFFDLKIFIKVSFNTMLERRLVRDLKERGYDENDVRYRFKNHVIPAHEKWVRGGEKFADVVIHNDSNVKPPVKETFERLQKLS